MIDVSDTLSLACPFCSTKEHAVIPMATKAKQLHAIRRTEPKWALLGGCVHANPNGLRLYRFDSEFEANDWWKSEVTRLRSEKELKRQQLEETFKRINEKKTRATAEEFYSPPEAAAPMGDGSGRANGDEPKQLPVLPASPVHGDGEYKEASEPGIESPVDGGMETGMQQGAVKKRGAPLCVVGNNIYQKHSILPTGECERCGWSI